MKELGIYTYDAFFCKEAVVPDILSNDYARGVIEFARHIGHKFSFQLSLVRPPLGYRLPEVFPTDAEIDRYKIDNKKEGYKDYLHSQQYILDSMGAASGNEADNVGAFRKHVFNAGLQPWSEADTDGLSNLAIQWIFE